MATSGVTPHLGVILAVLLGPSVFCQVTEPSTNQEDLLKAVLAQQLTLSAKIDQLSHTNSVSHSGSVYIRWGRTVCPAGADLVYEGYAGGTFYSEPSGMSEYLCLPKNPQWNRYKEGFQRYAAHLYGGEYQMEGHEGLLDISNNNGQSLHQNNVPCAVCHVTGRGSVMTFPALRVCPRGWHLEYEGYLMSPASTASGSGISSHREKRKPECMDESPEIVPGGQANENGALFYFVEAKCGSLPCGPYVNGREITCAVCTR